MQPPRLRRRHSARQSSLRLPPPPRRPNGDMEIYSRLGGRSPDAAGYLPESAYPTQSARDMLERTESAAACRSQKTEQVCCHPQTPPWNESSTADAPALPPLPVACE